MAKPYAIYFKKMRNDALVVDTLDNWGIVCKEFPFKLYGEAKELPSHDWKDKDGDDEYIPSELPIAAYELEVEFVYKGDVNSANGNIRGFLDYLTGRGGTGAEFFVYDSYTKIGRQHVRYVSVGEDVFHRQEDGGDVVVFNVTFKVNDPITDITLSKE
jgi:hypothetical protein